MPNILKIDETLKIAPINALSNKKKLLLGLSNLELHPITCANQCKIKLYKQVLQSYRSVQFKHHVQSIEYTYFSSNLITSVNYIKF